jgi:hypothetical protein
LHVLCGGVLSIRKRIEYRLWDAKGKLFHAPRWSAEGKNPGAAAVSPVSSALVADRLSGVISADRLSGVISADRLSGVISADRLSGGVVAPARV